MPLERHLPKRMYTVLYADASFRKLGPGLRDEGVANAAVISITLRKGKNNNCLHDECTRM
jgi:hypothetical protein